MKTKTTYVCEVCHTEYKDKEVARRCEVSHVPMKDMKIVDAKYHPSKVGAILRGWPSRITLKDSDGNTREYSA